MGLFNRRKRGVTSREMEYEWKADVLKAVISRMNNPQIMDGKVFMPSYVQYTGSGQLEGVGSNGTPSSSAGSPSAPSTSLSTAPGVGSTPTIGSGSSSSQGYISPPVFRGQEEEIYEATGNYGEWTEKLEVGLFKDKEKDFLKDFSFEGLYFENTDEIIRMIASALANGKHLIFYGPPGTGKTTIAKEICNFYGVDFDLVTVTSDWSTFDTIGGYLLDSGGNLVFNPGLILKSYKEEGEPANRWLIIDEINRADIDKAFGPMFSALTGDDVTLPHKINGKNIHIRGKPKDEDELEPHRYFIHPDWRILASLNTFDKASLYEMSYAFMRRFSFIPIMIPDDLEEAVEELTKVWGMDPDDQVKKNMLLLWKHINKFRRIGPAIVQDMFRSIIETNNYNAAIIMYVLPQFEGLEEHRIKEFLYSLTDLLMKEINVTMLKTAMEDFSNIDLTAA